MQNIQKYMLMRYKIRTVKQDNKDRMYSKTIIFFQ